MNVVVIGGGVSGLAVAYNLITTARARGTAPPNVTVLEASERFGGNADTVQFTFGDDADGKPMDRWADLGVNDFNATAYTHIVGVMNTIGFEEGTDYRLLEDTTCYFSADGTICFTDDGAWNTGEPPELKASVDAFMIEAANDAIHCENGDPAYQKYGAYTLEQYIDEKSKANGWDPRLGPQVIYPRVNGMYFVSETGPRQMPFLAVMHYYRIQEGMGGQPARRMYFVGGASRWIDRLTAYMQAELGIVLKTGFKAVAAYTGKPWTLINAATDPPGEVLNADIVVVATHADDGLRLFITGLPSPAALAMAKVEYANGIVVAHTDSRLLPVDYNAWRTYNILIHEPLAVALKPYTISYVCNRHQNDAANPDYDKFDLPLFFVTVNPPQPIPSALVLTDLSGQPAIANLRHNLFDFGTMQAQADIVKYQGDSNLYYAGGWTYGSGLHEECWEQGIAIAGEILDHIASGGPKPDRERPDTTRLVAGRLGKTAK